MMELTHSAKEKIRDLESQMAQLPQAEVPCVHHFSEGLYAREIFIPAGTLLTGAEHKHGHINIISKGTITVYTDDGMQTLSAPHTIVSSPGIKRLGFAHTDVVWVTILATEETDVNAIENTLVDMRVSPRQIEVP